MCIQRGWHLREVVRDSRNVRDHDSTSRGVANSEDYHVFSDRH
jgi:hypothetical protein